MAFSFGIDPVLAGLERQLSFDSSRITLQEKSGEHKNHIVLSLYALKLACEEGRISEEEKALLKFFIMKKKSDYPTSIRHKLSSFENTAIENACRIEESVNAVATLEQVFQGLGAERYLLESMNAKRCIVCFEFSVKGTQCTGDDHHHCAECLSKWVTELNSEAQNNVQALFARDARVLCTQCRAPMKGNFLQFISEAAAEGYVESHRFLVAAQKDVECDRKMRDEINKILKSSGLHSKEETENLRKNLKKLDIELLRNAPEVQNSRQCARCSWGPINHSHCSSIRTHQGQTLGSNRAAYNNACVMCGWIGEQYPKDYPPWDRKLIQDFDSIEEAEKYYAMKRSDAEAIMCLRLCDLGYSENAAALAVAHHFDVQKATQWIVENYLEILCLSARPIRIVDITGAHGEIINGVYHPTTEVACQLPVYRKQEDPDIWLEYSLETKCWGVRNTKNRGLNRSYAYIMCRELELPESVIGNWQSKGSGNLGGRIEAYTSDMREDDTQRIAARNSAAVTLRISGVEGELCDICNGVYDPTNNLSGTLPVFVKRDDPDIELSYCGRRWGIHMAEDRGTTATYAHMDTSGWLLPQSIGGPLNCSDTNNIIGGVVQKYTDELAAADAVDIAERNRSAVSVKISLGPWVYYARYNGVYEPTAELRCSMPVYKKRGDRDLQLEFCRRLKSWGVRDIHSIDYSLVVQASGLILPHQIKVPFYSLYYSGILEESSIVLYTEQMAIADARKQAALRRDGTPIKIIDMHGSHAHILNGVYDPTSDTKGTLPVYRKRDDYDIHLEYNTANKRWEILVITVKGARQSFAFIKSSVVQLPELVEGSWISTAEGKLNGRIILYTPEMAISDEVEKQRRLDAALPIRIQKVSGENADVINGIYLVTSETSCGWPVFRKRDDPDIFLEFRSTTSSWGIRSSEGRGTNRSFAYVAAKDALLPHLLDVLWKDGSGQTLGGSIDVFTPKMEAEETELVNRRLASAKVVKVYGVIGDSAHIINGMYRPTQDIVGGLPVYRQIEDPDIWLEYCLTTSSWDCKDSESRGKGSCFAYAPCSVDFPESISCDWRDPDGDYRLGGHVEVIVEDTVFTTTTRR